MNSHVGKQYAPDKYSKEWCAIAEKGYGVFKRFYELAKAAGKALK